MSTIKVFLQRRGILTNNPGGINYKQWTSMTPTAFHANQHCNCNCNWLNLLLQWANSGSHECFLVVLNKSTLKQSQSMHLTHMVMGLKKEKTLVCLGLMSCWKVHLRPSLRSWELWSWFSSRISLYFAPFIFPSILTSLPIPAAETSLTAWCCHHHASP